MERVAPGAGVPLGERRARLQEAGDEPVVDEREPRDVRGRGDGARGGLGVAALPVVDAVARDAVVQRRRAIGEARRRRRRRRAAPRSRTATASAPSCAAAGVAATTIATGSPTWRTRSIASGCHGGSANGEPSRFRMPPPRSAISVGIAPTPSATRSRPVNTPSTPATSQRRCRVDRHHVGVGVRRAHERGVGLTRRVEVVGVAALPGQEPHVLAPLDRRADAEGRHGSQNSRRRGPEREELGGGTGAEAVLGSAAHHSTKDEEMSRCAPCRSSSGASRWSPATIPTPEPTGEQVLVRVESAGVCHSDVHIWDGYFDLGGGNKVTLEQRGVAAALHHGPRDRRRGGGAGAGREGRRGRQALRRLPVDRLRRLRGLQEGRRVALPDAAHARHPDRRRLRQPCRGAAGALPGRLRHGAAGAGRDLHLLRHHRLQRPEEDPGPRRRRRPLPDHRRRWRRRPGGAHRAGLPRQARCWSPTSTRRSARTRARWVRPGRSTTARPTPCNRCCSSPAAAWPAAIDFVGSPKTMEFGINALRKGGKLVMVGLYGGAASVSTVLFPFKMMSIEGSYVGTLAGPEGAARARPRPARSRRSRSRPGAPTAPPNPSPT